MKRRLIQWYQIILFHFLFSLQSIRVERSSRHETDFGETSTVPNRTVNSDHFLTPVQATAPTAVMPSECHLPEFEASLLQPGETAMSASSKEPDTNGKVPGEDAEVFLPVELSVEENIPTIVSTEGLPGTKMSNEPEAEDPVLDQSESSLGPSSYF